MSLPDDYIAALERLAFAFTSYRQRTGGTAVLVGGAATAIYTAGQFPSADFDIVAAAGGWTVRPTRPEQPNRFRFSFTKKSKRCLRRSPSGTGMTVREEGKPDKFVTIKMPRGVSCRRA